MGKSNSPLTFLTTRDFAEKHHEEFDELVDKGHVVKVIPRDDLLAKFDIGLDPRFWRTWTNEKGKIANLDMAIKAARMAKKRREKK